MSGRGVRLRVECRRSGVAASAASSARHIADDARLSPLKHRNLNLLGRYSFTAPTPPVGALRPLPDPKASELDEDDDGGGRSERRGPAEVLLRLCCHWEPGAWSQRVTCGWAGLR